jgi:formate--tetrahydrofolate ligase
MSNVPSDIAIAQAANPRPIADVARALDLTPDDLILYGPTKAKVRLGAVADRPRRGRLVLVTAINPTAAGEGKSTVTIGLTQAYQRQGRRAVACIREPSLGPVFGIKGGAAGGGYAQVIPMEDINLHFTGDFHAVSAAHNLLSAMLDNHLHQGNALGIDPRRITWPRTLDMNDRALRDIVVGLGGLNGGVPRQERFVITPASEIMAILALARDPEDLEQRLGRIIVGATADRRPVRATDLKAQGAMALLLKDAVHPNLVQTLEGGPAFVHCGPFGNIAHGCNSIIATDTALKLADLVITEAGFGADLGAEKFFDIKCRTGGFAPEVVVVVATVRALKLHGGARKEQLATPDPGAVERGFANLARHLENVALFGVPSVVALNRFVTDGADELAVVRRGCEALRVPTALTEVWEKGGAGGDELAAAVDAALAGGGARFAPLYQVTLPIRDKIELLARKIYRAAGVDYLPPAERALKQLVEFGLGETPVCVAKTQYSFSDNAGPGLGKAPAAEKMRLHRNGTIEGLF